MFEQRRWRIALDFSVSLLLGGSLEIESLGAEEVLLDLDTSQRGWDSV